MQALRVLMFGWEFPPYQAGGLATACLSLVTGLVRRGVQVSLVVPFPTAAGSAHPTGLRLVSAASGTRHLRVHRVSSPLAPYLGEDEYLRISSRQVRGMELLVPYGQYLFDEVERFAAVAAEIASEEPHDVIDAHDWMTFAAGIRARQISGRPLVAHIHSTEFDRSGDLPNAEISRRELEGMAAASVVIANSHYLKRQVLHHYAIAEEKIVVVHWGIEEDRPEYHLAYRSPFPPNAPVVLFLGRVTRQKGPDYFIEVARRVADLVEEARFVVAGAGDLLPHIIERAAELDLADRVNFTGPLQGADVFRALQMAHICVMPSVSEPFGLVALESLKSGTPVLIPRESGVAEVLQNVFKVDFWDIDEMTNKIVATLRYPDLHLELRERGLEEVSAPQFGLGEPARRTEEIFRRAAYQSAQGVV